MYWPMCIEIGQCHRKKQTNVFIIKTKRCYYVLKCVISHVFNSWTNLFVHVKLSPSCFIYFETIEVALCTYCPPLRFAERLKNVVRIPPLPNRLLFNHLIQKIHGHDYGSNTHKVPL